MKYLILGLALLAGGCAGLPKVEAPECPSYENCRSVLRGGQLGFVPRMMVEFYGICDVNQGRAGARKFRCRGDE
jgi:hypothetical protein